jgi:hypothetical protein
VGTLVWTSEGALDGMSEGVLDGISDGRSTVVSSFSPLSPPPDGTREGKSEPRRGIVGTLDGGAVDGGALDGGAVDVGAVGGALDGI